jgi:hypothetical protein
LRPLISHFAQPGLSSFKGLKHKAGCNKALYQLSCRLTPWGDLSRPEQVKLTIGESLLALVSCNRSESERRGNSANGDLQAQFFGEDLGTYFVSPSQKQQRGSCAHLYERTGDFHSRPSSEVLLAPQSSAGRLDAGEAELNRLSGRIHHEQDAVIATPLRERDDSEERRRPESGGLRESERDGHETASYSSSPGEDCSSMVFSE